MKNGYWQDNAVILADAAVRLERAGADFIVIATNTMHKLNSFVTAIICYMWMIADFYK